MKTISRFAAPLALVVPAVLFALPAFAVQTRYCPEEVHVSFKRLSLFSADQIREFPRHAKYSGDMLDEALTSRDRAEKHFPEIDHREDLVLKRRENGRCIYRADTTVSSEGSPLTLLGLNSHKVILYTKDGEDLFREEFELPYQRRESETFVIESRLSDYGEDGVTLSRNEDIDLKVTVRYPCYDHRCLSEATIGSVSQDAQ